MILSREKLNQLIKEEIEIASRKSYPVVIEEDFKEAAAAAGIAAGTAALTSMFASTNGRERLADLLVAIPDFIKNYICDAPSSLWQDVESPGTASKIGMGISTGVKYLCRGVTSVGFLPLYAFAYILRLLTDDAARQAIEAAKSKKIDDKPQSPDIEDDIIDIDSDSGSVIDVDFSDNSLAPDIDNSEELVAEIFRRIAAKSNNK